MSQAGILTTSVTVQRGGDFRVNLEIIGVDGKLVMIGRDCDFVADDRDDEIWDLAAGFFGAVGLVDLD